MTISLESSDYQKLTKNPLVSVLMITYNHEGYIAEAIDSIISQQCGFDFELIIGEDASSDTTRDVVFEYQKKFPNIIRIIYSTTNVGMNQNALRVFQAARGRYIAYCEGDDYWCSNTKLEKQVRLIEEDASVGAVHSDWVRASYRKVSWAVDWAHPVHRRVPISMLAGNLFTHFYVPTIMRTCTLLVRRELIEGAETSMLKSKNYKFCDTIYSAFITSKQKISYLPEITAVYRLSSNSALRSGNRARIAFLFSALEFDSDARYYFKEREDYPDEYRWELCIGIILWSLIAWDFPSFRKACIELRNAYSFVSFVRAGYRSMAIHFSGLMPNAQNRARTLGDK
jgi:glycosyltransferase involved in cell wall biosynthesis